MTGREEKHLIPAEALKDYTNLRDTIAQMCNRTYVSRFSDEYILKVIIGHCSDEEFLKFYGEMKVEKNAIISILMDAVWNDLVYVEKRSKQETLKDFGVSNPHRLWALEMYRIKQSSKCTSRYLLTR